MDVQKKEWYTWIAERVKNKYGYETPSVLPQLYSQSRLDAFRVNKEKDDRQQKRKKEKLAAQRNASTSSESQSAPCSENGSSAGSDELPKSNAIEC